MIRHLLLAAASAAAIAVMVPAANAADLPAYEPGPAVAVVPSFTWTGPYVGIQAGYSWGSASKIDPEGFVVGGFAGYNYQFDASPVVIGIETDFNYSDVDDRGRGRRVENKWSGATRAKLGYAFDRYLVYAAGGVAYADRELSVRGLGKDSKTAVGYTVGAGVEAAVTDEVLARVEYRYTDYGKDTFKINGTSRRGSASDHSILAGVSYKFSTAGF